MSGAGRPEDITVDAAGLTLGIVCTRWHEAITDRLLERALAAAKACGVDERSWPASPARSNCP